MNKFKIFLLTILSFALPIIGQTSEKYVGKLDLNLAPDLVHIYQQVFKALPHDANLKFKPEIEKDSVISTGELVDQRTPAGKYQIFLVEPPKDEPFLCADFNSNGIVDAAERFKFYPTSGSSNDLDLILKLPIKNTLFKSFPLFIRYKRGFSHPKLAPSDRLILQSAMAFAMGHVNIRGRDVLFQYPFEPQSPLISTTEGLFGVDVNGDGRIQNVQFSPETSYASNKEIVFRLGDLYISTAKIDLEQNQIVIRSRNKSEYLRNELEVGKEMPIFDFVDFENNKRSLSEFRGKYLLIDFWGVWCSDCRRETPFQVSAMQRFRSRGFDILGLNWDENPQTAKDYIAENKMGWTQARKDSIVTLTEDLYRIQEYPSTVLLGPDGKVITLDQDQLQGEHLIETLNRVLPKR
jgi:thiol-disulfide isomerase/thioredoxin